jgi:hypothetical protein
MIFLDEIKGHPQGRSFFGDIDQLERKLFEQ